MATRIARTLARLGHLTLAALALMALPLQQPATNAAQPNGAGTDAAIATMLAEQVDTLSQGRTCWATPPTDVIPSTLMVRNARPGIGPDKGDTGVVRLVTFDEGWAKAEQGVVWVLGACK